MDTERKPPIDRSFSMREFVVFCAAITVAIAMFRVAFDAYSRPPVLGQQSPPIGGAVFIGWILLSGAIGVGSFTLLFGRNWAIPGGCIMLVVSFVFLMALFFTIALSMPFP